MKPLYKQTAFFVAYFVLAILACRFTRGMIFLLIAAVGAIYGASGRRGHALVAMLTIPFLTSLNPILLHKGLGFHAYSRISFVVISFAVIGIGLTRESRLSLPLAGLAVYLVFAFLSSLQGWFPMISILKIISFGIFIVSLHAASKLIATDAEAARMTRAAILAAIFIYVHGSFYLIPFPEISYLTSLTSAIINEGVEAARATFYSNADSMRLFCGITNESQVLGPLLVCSVAILLCDALLVERKIDFFHWFLIAPAPFGLFMTRSRLALLLFVAAVACVIVFCLPKARMNAIDRRHVLKAGAAFFCLMLALGAVSEIRDHSITKWLRKSNQFKEDDRSLTEALTSSRMGCVAECLKEFKRNPMLGSGFQVIEAHPRLYKEGYVTLFSAPIEKGLLPLMVLGETGIIGVLIFAGFVFFFLHACHVKWLYATSALFVVLLMSNMGEAWFFSPGGAGGIEWTLLMLGGFTIDCMSVSRTMPLLPPAEDAPPARRRMSARRKYRSPEPAAVANG